MANTPPVPPRPYDPAEHRYPAWRYHATKGAQVVNDPNEEAALGAGWTDSPATASMDIHVSASAVGRVSNREEALEAEARDKQFSLSVTDIASALDTVTDRAALGRIRARELLNPEHKGGRKGVLAAADHRLKALDPRDEPAAP